jgi:ABC-type sulfate/molybdate transport systems ATPase subunit
MRRELLKIKERFTIPVILITPDPEDVAALAETVVVDSNGRVSTIMSPIKEDYPVKGLPSLSPLAATLAHESSFQTIFLPEQAHGAACFKRHKPPRKGRGNRELAPSLLHRGRLLPDA